MRGTGADNGPEDSEDGAIREAAIREIINLLEEALRRCDGDALHIAAIHIDRALHECNQWVKPPDDKGGQ